MTVYRDRFRTLLLNQRRCTDCGCYVADDHEPDSDQCHTFRQERDNARRQ